VNLLLDPGTAAKLAEKTVQLILAGRELSSFGEEDPTLAGECGVEICSLEARTILSSGAPARVAQMAGEAARGRRQVTVSSGDLETLSRLEAVVAMGSSRIGLKLATLDASASQEPMAKLGTMIGLATGAAGFIRSLL
jgi:hypothetical protein